MLALVLLLVGARLSGRVVAVLLIATPVGVALLGLSLGLWVDPARVDTAGPAASVVLFEVGDWTFTLGAYLVGLATALRIAAILMLSLIAASPPPAPNSCGRSCRTCACRTASATRRSRRCGSCPASDTSSRSSAPRTGCAAPTTGAGPSPRCAA